MKQTMSDFDIFYLSYDEPKCEENWADLLQKAPWAKRVHGVKGFDNAHRACAMQSETERFITVDGDNIIDERFLEQVVDIPDKYKNCSFSWNSVNAVNGLVYGNGGLKLWTVDWVMNMKSHENAEDEAKKLDFCWDKTYLQLNSVWSTTYPNGSAFQAFRAGFREGCKMTLDEGGKVDPVKVQKVIYQENLRRLLVWSCIGADVDHGLAAIYGTRLGIYMTNIEPDFELAKISDYDWFKDFGNEKLDALKGKSRLDTNQKIAEEAARIGQIINKTMGLDLAWYHPDQSKFFKKVQVHVPSAWSQAIEKEIIA
jgi:hypothetical protein